MNEPEERGPWYLLTGLLIGILLGLGYAWWVQPVEYVDTSPALLRDDFKDQYRALIAAAYAANNDLLRAQARLELLGDPDAYRTLSEQAQRSLAQESENPDARALGMLAIALGQPTQDPGAAQQTTWAQVLNTPVILPTRTDTPTSEPVETDTALPLPSASETPVQGSPSPAASETPLSTPDAGPAATGSASATPLPPATPTVTFIPQPTFTPLPTRTASATPGGPFLLLNREKICTQELPAPLIQIESLDRFGQALAGILVIVTWEGGEERFYTGLKPEKGAGYADFTPALDVTYSIRLGENGLPVNDLTAAACERQGVGRFWGAWLLRFIQP